jgi:hypothetical protein
MQELAGALQRQDNNIEICTHVDMDAMYETVASVSEII